MSARLSPQREAEKLARIERRMEKCRRRDRVSLADLESMKNDALDLAAELAAVRAERDEAQAESVRLAGLLGERDTELAPLRERAAAAAEYYRRIGVQGEEIVQLRMQLAEYEPLNPQQCPAGKHTDWLVDSEHTHACPWCQIDQLKAELAAKRDEIADDIHRAELPTFAETENPVLVAKTVRAIDVRLADLGHAAPYWVAKAGDRS